MQELFLTFFMIMFSAGVENFSVIFPNKLDWFLFYLCHNTRTNRCGAAGFWLNQLEGWRMVRKSNGEPVFLTNKHQSSGLYYEIIVRKPSGEPW